MGCHAAWHRGMVRGPPAREAARQPFNEFFANRTQGSSNDVPIRPFCPFSTQADEGRRSVMRGSLRGGPQVHTRCAAAHRSLLYGARSRFYKVMGPTTSLSCTPLPPLHQPNALHLLSAFASSFSPGARRRGREGLSAQQVLFGEAPIHVVGDRRRLVFWGRCRFFRRTFCLGSKNSMPLFAAFTLFPGHFRPNG